MSFDALRATLATTTDRIATIQDELEKLIYERREIIRSELRKNRMLLRDARGRLTQRDISIKSGTKESYVSNLETGRIDLLSEDALTKLIRVYVELSNGAN